LRGEGAATLERDAAPGRSQAAAPRSSPAAASPRQGRPSGQGKQPGRKGSCRPGVTVPPRSRRSAGAGLASREDGHSCGSETHSMQLREKKE
jgi:hypothetical protein